MRSGRVSAPEKYISGVIAELEVRLAVFRFSLLVTHSQHTLKAVSQVRLLISYERSML